MTIIVEKKVDGKTVTKKIHFEDYPIYLRDGWKESKNKVQPKHEIKEEVQQDSESKPFDEDEFSFKKRRKY